MQIYDYVGEKQIFPSLLLLLKIWIQPYKSFKRATSLPPPLLFYIGMISVPLSFS